jgi:DNA-directed RNA polymerase beta' subunit
MPEDALKILQDISNEDCILLGLRPDISRPENMIIKNLAVAPPPVRPSANLSISGKSEDDLTLLYRKIVQTNNSLLV